MKQPTQKDFEEVIMNSCPQLHYHVIDKIAQACYALALQMAQQAFNAARILPNGTDKHLLSAIDFKYDTFQDYKAQLSPEQTK